MKSPDDYLFHFTSAGALLSIITKRQLWASDSECLNDRLEGKLPVRLVNDVAKHPEIFPELRRTPEKYLETLSNGIGYGRGSCTISFSEHYKSLPQFRMYCPHTGGFAIGFPKTYLNGLGNMVGCEYSWNRMSDWVRDYSARFIQSAAELDTEDLTAHQLAHAVVSTYPNFIQERVEASLKFKSEEFINELEHRLIYFVKRDDLEFRESADRSTIIPYIPIDLPNEPIEVTISIGPSRDEELANKTVNSLVLAAMKAGTQWQLCNGPSGEFGFRA